MNEVPRPGREALLVLRITFLAHAQRETSTMFAEDDRGNDG